MKAGQEEIDRTRAVIETWRADIKARVTVFGISIKAAAEADEIVGLMARLVELVVAAEELKDSTEECAKKLRTYTAETMMATGATTVRANGVTGSVAEAARNVVIVDRTMIPPDYLKPREPELDRVEAGKQLRAGLLIPGLSLSNGGPPTLRITAGKAKNEAKEAA